MFGAALAERLSRAGVPPVSLIAVMASLKPIAALERRIEARA